MTIIQRYSQARGNVEEKFTSPIQIIIKHTWTHTTPRRKILTINISDIHISMQKISLTLKVSQLYVVGHEIKYQLIFHQISNTHSYASNIYTNINGFSLERI